MYKTELHCHSAEGSSCAHVYSDELAQKYHAAGYSTICLTNHFFPRAGIDGAGEWEKFVDELYGAYEKLVAAARRVDESMTVLMGMELRFVQNSNDYLVFGFDRSFLLEQRDIMKNGIRGFAPLARENGLYVIHAHPFRFGMTVTDPKYVDAIEVFNGHPGHESHNDLARQWATRYDKTMTSGTDHHDTEHAPRGGIATEERITDTATLIDTLHSGRYTLVCD